MKKAIEYYIEDIFIISGLIVINVATFLLSFIAGLYVTGFSLFGIGIYLANYSMKGRKHK